MRWLWKSKSVFAVVWLVVLTAILRLVPVFPDKFPFMFDHAKDSLVIMQMGTKFKPALIGAAASIPGVYYGPLWYYLALPLNVLLDYQPIASVLTVIALSAASVVVAYKYLGKLAATWYAVSLGFITTQSSAWSPYLTPLVTLPILIILLQLKLHQKISDKQLILLALLTSISFHFQPAFAAVLTPLVMLILWLLKVKINLKQFLLGFLFFLIPFTPQLIFEFRHDFHQSRQIMAFFQNYPQQARAVQPNQPGLQRLLEIGEYWLDSAGQAISPIEVPFILVGVGAIILIGLNFKKFSAAEKIIFGTFLIGTYLFYLILPAKQYYMVGLLPVWIALASRAVISKKKYFDQIAILILILLAALQLSGSIRRYQTLTQTENFLLSPKLAAIKKVYELADNQPFVSYQFVPETYDYTYQYLLRLFIRQGYPTPSQYSYAPGEYLYLQQVAPGLLPSGNFESKPAPTPAQVFLIVEKPVYDWAYDEWWGRVTTGLEIKDKYQINEAIAVYEMSWKTVNK